MDNKNLDKETQKIFATGDKLKSLVKSRGWGVAKEMLLKKVASLLNIKDIGTETCDPQSIVLMIGIRQGTARELMAWMREIEGTAEQHKANMETFAEVPDAYILHVDEVDELEPTKS